MSQISFKHFYTLMRWFFRLVDIEENFFLNCIKISNKTLFWTSMPLKVESSKIRFYINDGDVTGMGFTRLTQNTVKWKHLELGGVFYKY